MSLKIIKNCPFCKNVLNVARVRTIKIPKVYYSHINCKICNCIFIEAREDDIYYVSYYIDGYNIKSDKKRNNTALLKIENSSKYSIGDYDDYGGYDVNIMLLNECLFPESFEINDLKKLMDRLLDLSVYS